MAWSALFKNGLGRVGAWSDQEQLRPPSALDCPQNPLKTSGTSPPTPVY